MDLPRLGELSQGILPLPPDFSEAIQSPPEFRRFRAQNRLFRLRCGRLPDLATPGRVLPGSEGRGRTSGRRAKARGGLKGLRGSSKSVKNRKFALAAVPARELFRAPGRAPGGSCGPGPSRATVEVRRTSRPISSKVLGGSPGARLGGTSISAENGFSGRFDGPGGPDTGPPGVEPVGPEVWHGSQPNRTLRKAFGLRACP